MIPYGRQDIRDDEIQAVIAVLESDFLTTGPIVEAFEKNAAEYCGANYAVSVANGTAALHLAVMALDLAEGSEGITSPNSFVASANCMVYNRLVPRFADIDSRTYCIDPHDIRERISEKTKILIPVHFAGQSCDMEAIWDIACQKNLYVIEDAAHAFGTRWTGKDGTLYKTGSCSHSHITIFSFHPVKNITTGEGGMILTNDESLARKCRLLRNHGIERDTDYFEGIFANSLSKNQPWYYEMTQLGFNYRLTDLQCALGMVQLKRMDQYVEARRDIWNRYNEAFAGCNGFEAPFEKKLCCSAWHLYAAQAEKRDDLIRYLRQQKIGAHAMYIPIHLHPWYRKTFGFYKGDFPKSEIYFKNSLILPLFPTLSKSEHDRIINAVCHFYQKNEQRLS